MKKSLLLLVLLGCFVSAFSRDMTEPYILIQEYDYYGGKIRYSHFYEYILYDDGCIKYCHSVDDINEEIDFYNWENIRNQYIKDPEIDNPILYDEKSATKTIYRYGKVYDTKVWNFEELGMSKLVNRFVVVDDVVEMYGYTNPNWIDDSFFTVKYDSKNVYDFYFYPPKGANEKMKEKGARVFVSQPIEFSELAKAINYKIVLADAYTPIYVLQNNIIPKDKYTYSDGKQQFLFTNKEISLSGGKSVIESKNIRIYESDGMRIITELGKDNTYLLKTSDLAILYKENSKLPVFIGWDNNKPVKIIKATNIKTSSSLVENNKVYSADKLCDFELDSPWVEGVSGYGIDEYIEFDKKDATGMYIVNGFVSSKKPELYQKNSRVAFIEVKGITSGKVKTYRLADICKPQYIPLDSFSNERIRITIKDVYKGTTYDDTCIGGILLVKEK